MSENKVKEMENEIEKEMENLGMDPKGAELQITAEPSKFRKIMTSVLKFAAAAAVGFISGFGIGRVSSKSHAETHEEPANETPSEPATEE